MKILLCIIDTLSSLPGRSKYSRIFSCPDGITPNSGLTGLSILYIYIYIYIYGKDLIPATYEINKGNAMNKVNITKDLAIGSTDYSCTFCPGKKKIVMDPFMSQKTGSLTSFTDHYAQNFSLPESLSVFIPRIIKGMFVVLK